MWSVEVRGRVGKVCGRVGGRVWMEKNKSLKAEMCGDVKMEGVGVRVDGCRKLEVR